MGEAMRPVLTSDELQVLRTLERGCRKRTAPMLMVEIERASGIPPSSVGRILNALVARGVVTKIGARLGYIPTRMVDEIREKQGVTVTA